MAQILVKWKLVLVTVPLALLVVVAAYIRQEVLRIPSMVAFADLGATITGTTIIVGFMVAGVMADYKESESLPGKLTDALMSYGERIYALRLVAEISGDKKDADDDLNALEQSHASLVSTVEQWLILDDGVDKCYTALERVITATAAPSLKQNINLSNSRFLYGSGDIRKAILRIDTIRSTEFIKSGYAMLQVILVVLLSLLIVADFANLATQLLVIGFVSFIYIYLVKLIYDLDNPFSYKPDGSPRSAAEVSIEQIVSYGLALREHGPDRGADQQAGGTASPGRPRCRAGVVQNDRPPRT